MYLRAAQWGFDELLAKQLTDTAFGFYLIGILASLRAVQHALKAADSTLSNDHKRVRGMVAGDVAEHPRTAFHSNLITESSTGEEPNIQITGTSYELAYYDKAGKRQDLEEAIRSAIRWCDRELTAIEEKLPPVSGAAAE